MTVNGPQNSALISFDDVSIRVRDRSILEHTNWTISKGEHWAVVGPNGSGKSSLVRCFVDQYPVSRGAIHSTLTPPLRDHVGFVSFERHRRIITDDIAQDASRMFSGAIDSETTGGDLLGMRRRGAVTSQTREILAILDIESLIDTPVRGLSTGEMRRILIAGAVLKKPSVLVLDEPFDGLDIQSRPVLMQAIDRLTGTEMTLVIVTHRYEEIVPSITHVLCLKDQSIYLSGTKDSVLSSPALEDLYRGRRPMYLEPTRSSDLKDTSQPLIEMNDVSARFSGKTVFEHLNWRVEFGENWQVLGPNGCGKSTLLSLITGDNPQTYSNEVYLFGTRRGRGDSIWDVKRRIGVVSSALQIRYSRPVKVHEVVLSGFYESVGMYRRASREEHESARLWISDLHIESLAERRFDRLSFGEQRLVLIARAMIKSPDLLLLDEPFQGLDPGNREMILKALDAVGSTSDTSLIFVTHHRDEVVSSLTHRLEFIPASGGGYTCTSSTMDRQFEV